MGAEDVLLPTKKELALTSGAISVGHKHGLLLDRDPYPLNAVPQVSEHQQEAIFARAEPNPRQTSVRKFNTLGSWRSRYEKVREDGRSDTRQSCQEHGSIHQRMRSIHDLE
jgi:hypothetical protein